MKLSGNRPTMYIKLAARPCNFRQVVGKWANIYQTFVKKIKYIKLKTRTVAAGKNTIIKLLPNMMGKSS